MGESRLLSCSSRVCFSAACFPPPAIGGGRARSPAQGHHFGAQPRCLLGGLSEHRGRARHAVVLPNANLERASGAARSGRTHYRDPMARNGAGIFRDVHCPRWRRYGAARSRQHRGLAGDLIGSGLGFRSRIAAQGEKPRADRALLRQLPVVGDFLPTLRRYLRLG